MIRKTVEKTRPRQQGPPQPATETPSEARGHTSGFLCRIYWMIVGNMLVAFSGFGIVARGGALTRVDILYWLAAGSLVLASYADVRYFGGQTAEGEPATMKHWQRYSVRVLVVSVLGWLAFHGLGAFS
jgi:hypothetical protein